MSDESSGLQAQVQISDGLIVAYGEFPGGSPDPSTIEIRDVPESEAAKLSEPGYKHMNTDGTITVTPLPPPPLISDTKFESAEDAERLALVNERAATDPAFAALAELALKGVTV